MATFPNIEPSYASQRTKTPRVLRTAFGDGYSQRAGDGLNTTEESWNITFSNRDEADIDTIEDFLEARGGYESFDWTAPRDSTEKMWICSQWSRSFQGFDVDTITATFDRVYDLD